MYLANELHKHFIIVLLKIIVLKQEIYAILCQIFTVINLINVYCLKEKTRVILNGQ